MMDHKIFLSKIEDNREELFQLLSGLIQINSENFGSHGNEEQIAEYLGEKFRELGLETEVYSPMEVPGITNHIDYYAGRGLENRKNCTVLLPGENHKRRLMLAAHNDTETIGALDTWTVDPLGGEIRDGKIWGRGACDDKYGIAAAWFLIKLLLKEGIRLPYDLVFTAYCDEEKGGGNGTLAACLKYPSDDIVNLDCKNLEIWASGAGGGCFYGSFATKEPVDSCEYLVDALQIYREEMESFRQRRHDELMPEPRFADSIIPNTALRFQSAQIGGGLSLNRARMGVCFYTTRTEAEINEELEEIAARLTERLAPLNMVFEGFTMTTRFFRFAQCAESETLRKMEKAIGDVTGTPGKGIGSCLSDLPLFILHGSPNAFCFGAGRDFGMYGGAHQPDEFIECDKFLEFTKILGEFLLSYGEEE